MGAFSIFLKSRFTRWFLKVSNTIIDNNNIERLSSGHHWGNQSADKCYSFFHCMFNLPRQNIFVPPENTNLFIQSNLCRNDFDTGGRARVAGGLLGWPEIRSEILTCQYF